MRRSRTDYTQNGRNIVNSPIAIKVYRLLDPEWGYPCLPTDWIAALVGHDQKYVKTIALDSARDPYRYLNKRAYPYKSTVLWRTEKGDDFLIDKGYLTKRSRRTRAHRGHDIQDSIHDASIELGMRDCADTLQLWRWPDILEHPKTPEAIKFNPDPFCFTLSDGAKVRPDGMPFVLKHRENGALALFKETDRSTEDLAGNARITIQKKLLNWREIIESGMYQKIFGFPSAMLLFITIDQRRMERIMALAEKTLGSCSYILFKTTDDFEQSFHSVKPHTDILTTPWKRIKLSDFSLPTLSPNEKRGANLIAPPGLRPK